MTTIHLALPTGDDMTALLTTRDALAKVLLKHGHAEWDEFDAGVVADALFASGAFIDAATLADDEGMVARLGYDLVDANADIADAMPARGVFDEAEADVEVVLRALAAALSERTS